MGMFSEHQHTPVWWVRKCDEAHRLLGHACARPSPSSPGSLLWCSKRPSSRAHLRPKEALDAVRARLLMPAGRVQQAAAADTAPVPALRTDETMGEVRCCGSNQAGSRDCVRRRGPLCVYCVCTIFLPACVPSCAPCLVPLGARDGFRSRAAVAGPYLLPYSQTPARAPAACGRRFWSLALIATHARGPACDARILFSGAEL
jgi:hypothetical protein